MFVNKTYNQVSYGYVVVEIHLDLWHQFQCNPNLLIFYCVLVEITIQ